MSERMFWACRCLCRYRDLRVQYVLKEKVSGRGRKGNLAGGTANRHGSWSSMVPYRSTGLRDLYLVLGLLLASTRVCHDCRIQRDTNPPGLEVS